MENYKTVFVPSHRFMAYTLDGTTLAAVNVTRQCYRALKARGFIMTFREANKWATKNGYTDGATGTLTYGGTDGFDYKELQDWVGWMHHDSNGEVITWRPTYPAPGEIPAWRSFRSKNPDWSPNHTLFGGRY